jgi:hypothetical protein
MKDIKYSLNIDADGEFVSITSDGKVAKIYHARDLPRDKPTVLKLVGKDTGGNDIQLEQYVTGLVCVRICGRIYCF